MPSEQAGVGPRGGRGDPVTLQSGTGLCRIDGGGWAARVVDGVVAILFLAGALYAVVESRRAEADEALVAAEAVPGRQVVTMAFIVIFLAEWGDLTQILTATLAAHYHSPPPGRFCAERPRAVVSRGQVSARRPVQDGAVITVWFTADLQFGHRDILGYSHRPFADVEQTNDRLVQHWNEVVRPDDTVWVLGDVAPGRIEDTLGLMTELRGHKVLLAGNHGGS